METQDLSINHNGCSVCNAGEENYTAFRPINPKKKMKGMNKIEIYKGIDIAYTCAVVYTEVITIGYYYKMSQWCGTNIIERKYSSKKEYYKNANFFPSLEEAKKDACILKSISNKKFTNIRIVKR